MASLHYPDLPDLLEPTLRRTRVTADAAPLARPWRSQVEGIGRSISASVSYQVFARLGLFVKGLVFLVIGSFACLAATGWGGGWLNAYGVIMHLSDRAFGLVFLAVMILGFVGYVVFKVVAAICDTDGKGWRPIGILKRVSMLLKAMIYMVLAALGVEVVTLGERGDGSGDALARNVIGQLMQHSHGEWLVMSLGAAMVAMALLQGYMIRTAYVRRRLRIEDMRAATFRAITSLARIGYAARAIVILGTGLLMLSAGWDVDPAEARGLGGTLRWMNDQEFIPYLLAPVSVGLVAYGVFEMLLVYYRRLCIPAPAASTAMEPMQRTEPIAETVDDALDADADAAASSAWPAANRLQGSLLQGSLWLAEMPPHRWASSEGPTMHSAAWRFVPRSPRAVREHAGDPHR